METRHLTCIGCPMGCQLTVTLKNVYHRIDMNQIVDMIENTPIITERQKTFYIYMLKLRKELIIDKAYERALKIVPDRDS